MLSKILDYLNQNSGAIAVIFSGVVAIATIVYAILTWRLTSETKKMRESQTEPKISVNIQPEEKNRGYIDMIIQNLGMGAAHNINFAVVPDFEYTKGEFLSELGFIRRGIPYLAPNQKYQIFLVDILTKGFGNDKIKRLKTSFEVKVTYENSVGKSYEDVYIIDFSHLESLVRRLS